MRVEGAILPTGAEVVVDGNVGWPMSEDDPRMNVSIERSAMPLVLQWASELGGVFRKESSTSEADA